VANVIEAIKETKILPILRGLSVEEALFVVDCFLEADLRLLEVSLNQPDSYDVLEALVKKFGSDAIVGAGTVLTDEAVERVDDIGAKFLLAPNISERVLEVANERKLPYIPGALTPTEIQRAHELGVALIKIFPVRQLGHSYIKDVLASLNHIELLAVGGVNETNMQELMRAGAKAVGIGSNLYEKEWIESRDKRKIITRLEKFKTLMMEGGN